MNIFKRKKPIVVEIPPRPEPARLCCAFAVYEIKKPVLSGGKIFYPIGRYGYIIDYFTTTKKAEAVCDRLNVPIKKKNKAWKAEETKIKAARNKEIADWDAKYKNKAIRVEIK